MVKILYALIHVIYHAYKIQMGTVRKMLYNNSGTFITLENHCTQTVQSSRGGCSRQVHKKEYLAVNKGNILVNVLLLTIFITNYYHL